MMNIRSYMGAIVLVCLLGTLSGCVGKRPFLIAQLCLGDEQNVALFMNTMKSIARSQHMDFIDGSEATQRDLVSQGVSPNYPLIYIGVKGKNGIGTEGGNLGLSAYEVALGFTEGSNPAAEHRFANMVVGTLKQRWQVYVVPPNRGALPMKNCGEPGNGVHAR